MHFERVAYFYVFHPYVEIRNIRPAMVFQFFLLYLGKSNQ